MRRMNFVRLACPDWPRQSAALPCFAVSSWAGLSARHIVVGLDLITATRHDLLAREDYQQLRQHGIRVARDGVRWHRAEAVPGYYDWSSLQPMLRAAETAGVQMVWDLCHYGWPDH